MLDLAVGVVLGGAFGKIVTSLVNDILMPLIGILLGGVSFSELSVTIGSAALQYGLFIQSIIDFLIIAVSVFLFVRLMGRMKREKPEKRPKPPAPTKQEVLLTEIRDLLKANNEGPVA